MNCYFIKKINSSIFFLKIGLPPKSLKGIWTNDAFSDAFIKKLRKKYANFQFPKYFNWVDEGIVTQPQNQGGCGACATFTATSTIESCFIKVCMYF